LQIYQRSPNKPNFLLVVLLACAVMLVFFVLAYLFIDLEGGDIHIRHRHANPNAHLIRHVGNRTTVANQAIDVDSSRSSASIEAS